MKCECFDWKHDKRISISIMKLPYPTDHFIHIDHISYQNEHNSFKRIKADINDMRKDSQFVNTIKLFN